MPPSKKIKRVGTGKVKRVGPENTPAHSVLKSAAWVKPGLESHWLPGWSWFLFFVLLATGLFFLIRHQSETASIFLIPAAVLGVSFYFPLRRLDHALGLIGFGWLLVLFSLGSWTNFRYAFSAIGDYNLPSPVFHLALGLGLLLAYWRYLPTQTAPGLISKNWGLIWFWVIFLAAVFLRFQRIHEEPGCYWDDPAVCIVDPQGILNFHEHPMLMPLGQREPFFSYFLAGLWSLAPTAHAIFIQRLGGAILDLTAVWLFYFLGKEAGGVTVGLVAEALAAFSKPMIIEDLIGMTAVTVPLAVALVLWITFRLFKKPDWGRFAQWGLALGFAPYNYTPIRTWLPFIVTSVFVWIWFYKRKDSKHNQGRSADQIYGWGIVFFWNLLFLKVNNFIPVNSFLFNLLNSWWFWISVLLIYFILSGLLIFRGGGEKDGYLKIAPRFFLGVLLAVAIIYPLASDPEIAVHPSGLSIFHDQQTRTFHYQDTVPFLLLHKTWVSIETMFYSGQDRGDLNLPWDAFFEFHFVPLFVLGFVAFLSRPSWLSGFLLAGGFVGISTHVLSIDPHSAKLVAAIAPLSVLAGLGFQQFYSALKSLKTKNYAPVFGIFCLVYFGWAIWGTYDRVWTHYFREERIDHIIGDKVIELAPRNRIYMAVYPDFGSPQTLALLDQGLDLYILGKENPIYCGVGQARKDVVVLMHIGDKNTQNLVQEQFKNVSWTVESSNQEGHPEVLRIATIPAAEIGEKPGKLFYFQPEQGLGWFRDYFAGRYVLGAGLIDREEYVDSIYAPIPGDMGGRMVRISGNLNLAADETILFKTKAVNDVILKVDGKDVINLRPFNRTLQASKEMTLAQGPHFIEYVTYLQFSNEIPEVAMTVNGQDQLLGESKNLTPAALSALHSSFNLGH